MINEQIVEELWKKHSKAMNKEKWRLHNIIQNLYCKYNIPEILFNLFQKYLREVESDGSTV